MKLKNKIKRLKYQNTNHMKIIVIADIHSNIENITNIVNQIKQANLIVLTGDITHFGTIDDVKNTIDKLRPLKSKIFAVTGNCDPPEIENYLIKNNLSINRRHYVFYGIGFLGVSGSLPCPTNTPNEKSEEELEQDLQHAVYSIPKEFSTILITHQPPFKACDFTNNKEHIGSKAVRKFIEEKQPLLCLTGHIHEAAGVEEINNTKVLNPGAFKDGCYAVIEIEDEIISNIELKKF